MHNGIIVLGSDDPRGVAAADGAVRREAVDRNPLPRVAVPFRGAAHPARTPRAGAQRPPRWPQRDAVHLQSARLVCAVV